MEISVIIVKIVVVLIVLIGIYILSLKPNNKRTDELKPFEEAFIAHRGLFDDFINAPENSMKAFERAVEYGFGIELDVRLTKDKELVVFHDESLYRMCEIDKDVFDYTYLELQNIYLKNTKETIPRLIDVLDIVDSKVPLVIEIKAKHRSVETAKILAKIMENYKGVYCIKSFNPLTLGWYRKNYPFVLRGQLSSGYSKKTNRKWMFEGFIITYLIFNWYTKPDFISINHKHATQISYKICKDLYKVKSAAWTIRSKKELEAIKEKFDIIIFDSFIPKEKFK